MPSIANAAQRKTAETRRNSNMRPSPVGLDFSRREVLLSYLINGEASEPGAYRQSVAARSPSWSQFSEIAWWPNGSRRHTQELYRFPSLLDVPLRISPRGAAISKRHDQKDKAIQGRPQNIFGRGTRRHSTRTGLVFRLRLPRGRSRLRRELQKGPRSSWDYLGTVVFFA